MKKVFKFFLIAAVAALTVVSCSKPATTNKKENKDNQEQGNDNNNNGNEDETPAEEVKLAIDGKFGEWTVVDPVGGEDGVLLTKAIFTDDKLFFYIEADANALLQDNVPYANYLTLYLDCGGGASTITHWGGEAGTTYDVTFQIWLMQGGKATMANWDTGFSGKAKLADGVYKGEFCLGRATESLKENVIHYGMLLTDQYVDKDEDGGEIWEAGEDIGLSPEKGEDMAVIKKWQN